MLRRAHLCLVFSSFEMLSRDVNVVNIIAASPDIKDE